MVSRIYWISYNIDIVLMLVGLAIVIASFPIGDYFVKLNSSIDLTGSALFTLGIVVLATGIASSAIIRLFLKRRRFPKNDDNC